MRGATTAGFLTPALAHFRQRGVPVRGLRTDNGGATARGPSPPPPSGNSLRHRFPRPCRSQTTRQRQLPRFRAADTHQRPHGGIGGAVPASRL